MQSDSDRKSDGSVMTPENKPLRLLDIFDQLGTGELDEAGAVKALKERRERRQGRFGRILEALAS